MTALLAWCDHMRALVGLDAEKDAAAFADLCAPNGDAFSRSWVCKPNVPGDTNSSCMLVAVGGLEAFLEKQGVEPQQFAGPLSGARWALACDLANKHGALIEHPDATWEPQLGDIVHVARYVNGHAALHWFTLAGCEYPSETKRTWKSTDGGWKNARGFQGVTEEPRSFLPNQGQVLELTSWKNVVACIRVAKLLEGLGL